MDSEKIVLYGIALAFVFQNFFNLAGQTSIVVAAALIGGGIIYDQQRKYDKRKPRRTSNDRVSDK